MREEKKAKGTLVAWLQKGKGRKGDEDKGLTWEDRPGSSMFIYTEDQEGKSLFLTPDVWAGRARSELAWA